MRNILVCSYQKQGEQYWQLLKLLPSILKSKTLDEFLDQGIPITWVQKRLGVSHLNRPAIENQKDGGKGESKNDDLPLNCKFFKFFSVTYSIGSEDRFTPKNWWNWYDNIKIYDIYIFPFRPWFSAVYFY